MLIEVKNLSFTYPNQQIPALHNINLDIEEGEFVTVCGCSGSGKSTLLRSLKPALSPKGTLEGKIIFNGWEIHEYSERTLASDIGFVSQSPDNQIVTDKVWHELAFAMESLGFPGPVIRQRVSEMAMFFGIQGWFHKNVNELSGGQKQILCLASVMTLLPKVILLDEPTSQLDPIAALEFTGMLRKINRELGITIIITEHRLEEVIPLSDKLVVLDYGRVYVQDEPAKVCEQLKQDCHDMAKSMPVPVRVWSEAEDGVSLQCPLDVKSGRDWLKAFFLKNNITDNTSAEILEEKTCSSGQAALTVKDVHFQYDRNSEEILKGVSLTVNKGEIYCILGGNGTGKSTLLSVIAGIRSKKSGSVDTYGKKAGMLPQNPLTLFVRKTLREDLQDVCADSEGVKHGSLKQECLKQEELEQIISLCRLEKLLDRHPYDLSGGEQQRLALAKVLLNKSDIILLDEPTKGFEQKFKTEFIEILKGLKAQGKAILIVSHDVEFCAETADRCALFFDGMIVSENTPHQFFSGNSFYTTAANRMTRGIAENVITADELVRICNKRTGKSVRQDRNCNSDSGHKDERIEEIGHEAGADFTLKDKAGDDGREQIAHHRRSVRVRNLLMALIVLLAIPFTLYAGVHFLGDRKYLFISLLILLECMLPFILIFEGRSPQARELVMIAVFCSICIAGRGLFYMLPEFKPVVALVVIAGAAFGAETGFLVGAVTMLVSNIMFGQGPWTPWQMFALGMTGFLSGLIFHRRKISKNAWILSAFGGIAAIVIYGGIMNFSSVIMSYAVINREMILAYYASGLPMDMVRAAATLIFTLLLARPVMEKIERVKVKYDLK